MICSHDIDIVDSLYSMHLCAYFVDFSLFDFHYNLKLEIALLIVLQDYVLFKEKILKIYYKPQT